MEKYITTAEVSDIMNNLDQLEAFKCAGRMSDYISTLEEQMMLRYRWQGNTLNEPDLMSIVDYIDNKRGK